MTHEIRVIWSIRFVGIRRHLARCAGPRRIVEFAERANQRMPPHIPRQLLFIADSSIGSQNQASQAEELTYVDIDTFLATF